MALPSLGVAAAIAAHLVHSALRARSSAADWSVIEAWAPTIIPAYAGYTVAPWPALIWIALLATLGLALSAFSLAAVATRRERPWWLRAAALWLCVVVVAFGTVGLAQLGEWLAQVEAYGGLGGGHLRTFAVPALLEAVRWGLIWGWIPALVTALSGTRRRRPPNTRGALIASIALLVAAAAAGAGLAAATRGAAVSARTEVAQPAETAPVEPTDPPSDVADSVDPGFPGRCPIDSVAVRIAGVDAAAGSRFLAVEARNTSQETCLLRGVPDLAFATAQGNEVQPMIVPADRTTDGEIAQGDPVELAPGAVARAELTWRAPTGRPEDVAVLIAAWAGVPRSAQIETLDIVDGVEMRLTPWHAAG